MSTTQRDTIRDFLQRHAGRAQTIEDIVKGVSGLNEEQVRGHMERLAGYILEGNSEPDVAKQNADYAKAQDYIAEHALSIGVYDRLSTLAVSTKLKDVWQEHAQGGPTFYDAYFVK